VIWQGGGWEGGGRCTVTMVSDAPAIPPARSLRAMGGLLSVLSMLFTFDHTVCDETQIKEVQECGREVINFERQDEMQGRNLRVLLLPTIVQNYRYRAIYTRLLRKIKCHDYLLVDVHSRQTDGSARLRIKPLLHQTQPRQPLSSKIQLGNPPSPGHRPVKRRLVGATRLAVKRWEGFTRYGRCPKCCLGCALGKLGGVGG